MNKIILFVAASLSLSTAAALAVDEHHADKKVSR